MFEIEFDGSMDNFEAGGKCIFFYTRILHKLMKRKYFIIAFDKWLS